MESDYLRKLLIENPDVYERYQMKIGVVNQIDPFTLNINDLDITLDGIPPVTNMDIISYLVLTHSFYSNQQMKAYKSLQAYKYFESGFVTMSGTKKINDFYILVGKVKHSQRANLKPLNVWCIFTKYGSVSSAHCTCMAGNSEVCSHVGAMLFAVEYAHSKKQAMSCTDVKALWAKPSTSRQVPIVPVCEMEWGKVSVDGDESDIQPASETEMISALQVIQELGYTCPLMRITEPFASEIEHESMKSLPSVFEIFDAGNLNKNYSELVQLSQKINIDISEDQLELIEKVTANQNSNPNWFRQRAGRVTASKFKAVCRTNTDKPSLSLVKSVCYPAKLPLNTKATSWGISHEQIAVEEYTKHMKNENHENFIVNEVGLLVNKKWPQLAASPDRLLLLFCECCLGGCLEVKCPYLLHANNIKDMNEYLNMKSCCLVKVDDKITLNKNHAYYYQVQMQIFVSQLLYCDFVIWSQNMFFKERILPDQTFWESESKKALKFHAEVVMPELLGKYFTCQAGEAKILHWCVCKGVDDGRPMIQCDGDNCDTEWFHFECVGLTNVPDNAWICNSCISD